MTDRRFPRRRVLPRWIRLPIGPDTRVSILYTPSWREADRLWHIPLWLVRLGVIGGILLAILLVVMGTTWASLARKAARTEELQREHGRLLAREDSMTVLATQLASLANRERQLRFLSGLEEQRKPDIWLQAAALAASDRVPPLEYASGDAELTPTVWPLTTEGFVTRSLLADEEGDHPGIDIAVPGGSYVRAAGAGQVLAAAEDSVYGKFVLLDHGDGIWSRYGHALYLAVERGQRVRKGEVIALSGNTGRSTAPHLHFEIVRNGQPQDPFSMVSPPPGSDDRQSPRTP